MASAIDSSGLRQRVANGNGKSVTPSEEGKKTDQLLDSHTQYVSRNECFIGNFHADRDAFRYEFGGPWGVLAIMTGFPVLMYYLWICLVFYDGQLIFPKSSDDVGPFLGRMWEHIRVASRCTTLLRIWPYTRILGRES